jgi:hypothetical protein
LRAGAETRKPQAQCGGRSTNYLEKRKSRLRGKYLREVRAAGVIEVARGRRGVSSEPPPSRGVEGFFRNAIEVGNWGWRGEGKEVEMDGWSEGKQQ